VADEWTSQPDPPVGGPPILFRPGTFARHTRAVDRVLGDNHAVYPRVGRGRTTKPAKGAWGYLASDATISACVGLTLGTGTVTLCSRSGNTLTADGEDVQVYNPGGGIIGPKLLELSWTDNVWAVCLCGGVACSIHFCTPCNEFIQLEAGSVTDANGTWALDSTGTTGRIAWTTPNGYNGFDTTPTTIDTQYFYTAQCGVLTINFWVLDFYDDGSVLLYDVPDVSGEEAGATSTVTPSGCDPVTSSHSFTYSVHLPPAPADSATMSIPRASGLTCSPCCLPGPDHSLNATASGGVANNGTYSLTFIDEGNIPPARFIWGVTIPTIGTAAWNIGFYCSSSGGVLFVDLYTSGTVNDTTCTMSAIVDYSCDPIHIHFHSDDPRCFFTDVVIDEA